MNIANFLTIIQEDLQWKRVSNLPCVHTFYDQHYYINLCKYKSGDTQMISINIDDFKNNVNDIVEMDYEIGTKEFAILDSVYNNAIMSGEAIRTRQPLILESA